MEVESVEMQAAEAITSSDAKVASDGDGDKDQQQEVAVESERRAPEEVCVCQRPRGLRGPLLSRWTPVQWQKAQW